MNSVRILFNFLSRRCVWVALLLAGPLLVGHPATMVAPAPAPLPNPDFTGGDLEPAGWRLSGGAGRWVDRSAVEVAGSGEDYPVWRVAGHPFTSGAHFHFGFRARRLEGSGTVVAGPDFANRGHLGLTPRWEWNGHAFRVPDHADQGVVRLGQWHATGRVQFEAARLFPALPVHLETVGMILGEGESIRGGRYRFDGTFEHEGSNDHRPLARATAGFNTDRWVFSEGAEVIYHFNAPTGRFSRATLEVHVNYHLRGACQIDVRTEHGDWHPVGSLPQVGSLRTDLPPAETIELRLKATGYGAVFQVNRIGFHADLDVPTTEAIGRTVYARIPTWGAVLVEGMVLREPGGASPPRLAVTVRNPDQAARRIAVELFPAEAGRAWAGDWIPADNAQALTSAELTLEAGQSRTVELPVERGEPGEQWLGLVLRRLDAAVQPSIALLPLRIAEFERTDYGHLLTNAEAPVGLWWCEAGWKIPRERTLPSTSSEGVRMSAARRDREGVQVVVQPREPLSGLRVTAGPFSGPDGAVLPTENVRVLRVYYHFVHAPTDSTGTRGYWPDALPPWTDPVDVAAGQNQPVWLSVDVPADAPSGVYRGSLLLSAEGFTANVPVELEVWDFSLPEQNHLETAFGFSPWEVFRYHGLETETDRRRVLDLYFEAFARNRISPYNPTPLDPIRIRFQPETDPPRADVDFTVFEPAMRRTLERFAFTGFQLPIPGMGGGTFHSRSDPRIGAYGEETPEYQTMFSSLVTQLEARLADNDWLDRAYIYWFDEPAPGDYPFVLAGMERLNRYAPRLRRMLTEEPVEPLFGHVDIWCPVSSEFDPVTAATRRAHSERFWSYICTVPKAPYATLFIDHRATELREMLHRLRTLLAESQDRLSASERAHLESLLEVPPTITTDMTTFTTDPRPIHRHRAKVAAGIVLLLRGLSRG
jgi:hypothetical protein